MHAPISTVDEAARLEAIRRYDILDTPPDGAFDRITALAARFCDVPIATITIVDEDRIWFKSACGIDVEEIPREPGLCASAVMQHGPYVVDDAKVDPRTLNNSLVRGELGLRFYAAVPLTTSEGHNLGTLNVIDVEPRELTVEERATLEDLAAVVMNELELRLAARRTVELETERANARFREQVLAGLSHDMRTPLAILKGVLDLGEGDGGSEAERREMRELARRQVLHLDWLVRQFLDFANLEADQQVSVAREEVDLREVAQTAAEVFSERADITVDVEPGTGPALADHDRTLQIVLELLNNAVRFTDEDEEIVIAVAPHGPAGERVGISVRDHGPGIDPEAKDRLFDKFFRVGERSGSGVGLYVSHALAQAQGGELEVDSEVGVGSRFTVVLPTP